MLVVYYSFKIWPNIKKYICVCINNEMFSTESPKKLPVWLSFFRLNKLAFVTKNLLKRVSIHVS